MEEFQFIFPVSSWTVSCTLFSVLAFLSWGQMRLFSRRSRMLAKFPSMKTLPFVGGLWFLLKTPTPEGIREGIGAATRKFGRKFVFWLSHKSMVVIVEAKSAQKILSSPKHVEKGSDYNKFKWLMGNGLITAPATIWKEDRKILSPCFKYQSFDGFLAIFNKNARTLTKILGETFSEKEGNIHPALCRASMDSITAAALGRDSNFQEDLDSQFMDCVYMALENFRIKTIRPYLCFPIIKDILGIPAQEKLCKEMFSKYVEEAKKSRLQILGIEKKENNNKIVKKDEGTSYPFIDALLSTPDIDITGHIVNIFGAGFETTASTMNYTLFLLALNPDCLAKVHQELDIIFGDNAERDITFEDVAEMKYLELCFKEALRLFPSIPIFIRRIQEDVELEPGLIVPKGCDVVFPIHELHRDPEYFPDPEKFDPDRFLPDNCVERHPYAYMPFSMGPRNCIGMRYAFLQLKTTLAHILRTFRVNTKMKREDLRIVYGMVLEPSPNIELRLTKRR